MGLFSGFFGEVGKRAGKEVVKRFDEHQANKEAERQEMKRQEIERINQMYMNKAFRLPQGFCVGANGKVWRCKKINGNQLLLTRKGKSDTYEEWFDIDDVMEYYEDI